MTTANLKDIADLKPSSNVISQKMKRDNRFATITNPPKAALWILTTWNKKCAREGCDKWTLERDDSWENIHCSETCRYLVIDDTHKSRNREIIEMIRNGTTPKDVAEMYDMNVTALYEACAKSGNKVSSIMGTREKLKSRKTTIIELIKDGVPVKEIADRYSLKPAHIYTICSRYGGGVQSIRGY